MTVEREKELFINHFDSNPYFRGLMGSLMKDKCYLCRYKPKETKKYFKFIELLLHLSQTHGLPKSLFI